MKENYFLYFRDINKNHNKFYEISFHEGSVDLFSKSKVVIKRGRIGQNPETIERFFDSVEEGKIWFEQRVKEKLAKGYKEKTTAEFDGVLYNKNCALCELVMGKHNEPTFVFEFSRTLLYLNWDQSYKGRSFLILKNHIQDLLRLIPTEVTAIMREITLTEQAIRKAFDAQMVNYLFMGNRSMHMHIHLVPRYFDDPNFGNSPFLDTKNTEKPQLTDAEYLLLGEKLKEAITNIWN